MADQIIKQTINPNEAPPGKIACMPLGILGQPCAGCCYRFWTMTECPGVTNDADCIGLFRNDKCDVIFKVKGPANG